jgi:predicted metalloprotease with PDZ domain
MNRFTAFLFLLFLAATTHAAPPKQVVYTVSVSDIPSKTFRVSVRAEGVTDKTVTFALPAWTPGWYVIQNFEKNIENVRATGSVGAAGAIGTMDGVPRAVEPLDARTWQVATGGLTSVTLTYHVRAADRGFGFFQAYLDKTNGFVNGPACLMYVVDGKTAPCAIHLPCPAGLESGERQRPGRG